MASTRTSASRAGRRIIVSPPVQPRPARVNTKPAPLQARPAPRVTWSVFAIEPDGSYAKVETGLEAQKATDRARQLWCAEQDNGGDRDFAPGLWRPNSDLAAQEVREVNRWILDGKPKPWDYD